VSKVIFAAFLLEAVLIVFCTLRVVSLTERWRCYVRTVSVCGTLPPPPSNLSFRTLRMFSRAMCFVQVGRVNVFGKEYLDSVPGPKMICANHPFGVDGNVLAMVLNRKVRVMVHGDVFKAAGGLGAHIFARWGAFVANDKIRDRGVRARAAAVDVLTSGQTLVLLPEGLTNMQPTMLPLQNGAVRIVKQAAQESGEETWIVPAHLRYGVYPGAWIQRFPRPLQYALVLLLFPLYRRGVTVTFGKPLAASELAPDHGDATAQLREAIECAGLRLR
jgi:1-acyl-sn-glycerol-3-phosphate acyltransferase